MDSLGDRMKCYENVNRIHLTKRMPAIIRIDGRAFHTFTHKFERPFDLVFMQTMWETTKYLCKNIEGCKVAYTQSDEISLLLTDYENLTTQSWFDKNVQKMVSVSASLATAAFNWWLPNFSEGKEPYTNKYNIATFDSRVFIIPKEEVCNYFIWRQQDATRNAIQSVGQSNFSPKQMHGKNTSQIQDMLFLEKQINFNDISTDKKRGICFTKQEFDHNGTTRTDWFIDKDIPIFTEDRNYIEKFIE